MNEYRQQRRNRTAEIFTQPSLVEKMLGLLPAEAWQEGRTFLDPACGNGNMLVCVLQRKLSLGHAPLQALQSVYGADIMADNIKECRLRLLKIVSKQSEITKEMVETVLSNIVCTKGFKEGSLGYDFSFPHTAAERTVREWKSNIKELLEKVDEEGLAETLEDSDAEKDDAKDAAEDWVRPPAD